MLQALLALLVSIPSLQNGPSNGTIVLEEFSIQCASNSSISPIEWSTTSSQGDIKCDQSNQNRSTMLLISSQTNSSLFTASHAHKLPRNGQSSTFEFWWKGSFENHIPDDELIASLAASAEASYWIAGNNEGQHLKFAVTEQSMSGWIKFMAPFTIEKGVGFADVNFVWSLAEVPANNSLHIKESIIRYTSYVDAEDLPEMTGVHDQALQIRGVEEGVYNLVSSETTQVNGRFTHPDEATCSGANDLRCKSGLYLIAVGIAQVVDNISHKLAIASGSFKQGFLSVTFDGEALEVGDAVDGVDELSIDYVSARTMLVNTSDFAFIFENSDKFIKQIITPRRPLEQLTSHGLFGQSDQRMIYPAQLKYIEGAVSEYKVRENELFGHDFMFNRFHHCENCPRAIVADQ